MFAAVVACGVPAAVLAPQASALSPTRGYELVSPPNKEGQPVSPVLVDATGDRVVLFSGGAFAGAPSQDGLANNYLSVRDPAVGWKITPLNLPATEFDDPGLMVDSTPELSRFLLIGATPAQAQDASRALFLRDADGGITPASPAIKNWQRPDEVGNFVDYVGAAKNFSSIVISSVGARPLLEGEPAGVISTTNLYEVTGALTDTPSLRRVDVETDGSVFGAACPKTAGGARSSMNAVSEDGNRIFFSARRPSNPASCAAASRGPIRIFARIAGQTTEEISASQCDRVPDPLADPPVVACLPPGNTFSTREGAEAQYRGASLDGDTVFFTTTQQLTNSDTDESDDLYEYRFNPTPGEATLQQASAAFGSSATPGNGASVLGVLRTSNDGNRAYFVARGKLTSEPNIVEEEAVAGAPNLYLFERTDSNPDGTIRFVATLAEQDGTLWGNDGASKLAQLASDEGRVLVFPTAAPLTDDDTDGSLDVYRFDAETGQLQRISHGGLAANENGNLEGFDATIGTSFPVPGRSPLSIQGRAVSSDGNRIVFATSQALVPADENETRDLYEWNDGMVDLITDGVDTRQVTTLYSVASSGASIVFTSAAQLVVQDVDTAADAYASRLGGGFPAPEPELEEVCIGEACQGPLTPPPGHPSIGTVVFNGDGNLLRRQHAERAYVRVSKLKTATGKVARMRVKVPAAGRISVAGRKVRKAGLLASKAGAYTVKVSLKPRAKRTLKNRKSLKVPVRVSYRAKGGRSASRTVSVTFRQPTVRQATVRKGGR